MYGLNIDPAKPGGHPPVRELASLGVRTVRFPFKDSSGDSQPDPARLTFYGQIIEQYAAAGIRSLLTLSAVTVPGAPSPSASKKAWIDYIARFVARIRPIVQAYAPQKPTFQIWQEPDLAPRPGYVTTVPPASYGRLLQQAFQVIKAIDQDLTVITAGLVDGPVWLSQVQHSLDGTLPADAIALHPYHYRPEPNWPASNWGKGYISDWLHSYQRVAQQPLMISEIGDNLLSPAEQGEYLRRFYQTMQTEFKDVVQAVIWFCYSDDMVPPFGLKEANQTPKPAYLIYQALASKSPSQPLLKADTIISRVALSKGAPVAGDEITFEATVRNVGDAATGNTVGVAFLIDDVYLTFGSSPALGPRASRVIRAVARWQATAGDHRLTAVVDDVHRYPEVSEDNNARHLDFTVAPQAAAPTLSHMVVEDVAFERTDASRILLTAQVTNKGQAETAHQVGVAFFVNQHYLTYGLTEPLAAGETRLVRAERAFRLTGKQTVTALVDDVNRFSAAHETNQDSNRHSQTLDFGTPPAELADTIIEAVLISPNQAKTGTALTFEAIVKNIGGGKTADVVGVAFLVNDQYVTYGIAPPLPAGQTRNIRAVSSWQAVTGLHRLKAIVDDVNRYPEASKTNNQYERSFTVLPPPEAGLADTIIDQIEYEREGSGEVRLKAIVSNIGTAITGDVVGVAFFIDGKYATFGIVPPIAAGETTTVVASQTLPLYAVHIVRAIVDDVHRYDEISYQNNTRTSEISFHRGKI